MRRRQEEEEEDEHTIKYTFQPKALLPGLFIKLIRSINTPLQPSCESASETTASAISN